MKKKILAFMLALAMILCALPSYAYSVRDAYSDFVAQYPGFVDTILSQGEDVSESLIINFLSAIQKRLYSQNKFEEPITEENFDEALINVVTALGLLDEYAPLQKAIYSAYPDASYNAYIHHQIDPELMPLYEAVKAMIFEHNMLEDIDSSGDTTTALTEISAVEAVSVEQGGTLSLPASVEATSETGVKASLRIEWTSVPDTSSVGQFTAKGTVVIPDGFILGDGVSADVSAVVTVVKGSDSGNTGNTGSTGNTGNSGTTTVIGGTTGTTTDTTVTHKYTFTDVNDATESGKAIYALSDMGLLSGYGDGTFKPATNITRAEVTTMIVRALDVYDYSATTTFTDVPDSEWYYSYIASAAANSLINGYEDGSFRPANNITRAEVMTMVYNVLNSKKVLTATADSTVFADDESIPAWSRSMVYALRDNGVISAVADNNIHAEIPATREQCAVMMYSMLKKLGKIK